MSGFGIVIGLVIIAYPLIPEGRTGQEGEL